VEGEMTEDDKKIVTEWLGEETESTIIKEWSYYFPDGVKYTTTLDPEDGTPPTLRNIHRKLRTFTEWQDYGDVFETLVGKGAWEKFMWFCEDRFGSKDNTIMPWTYQLFQWLHSRTESGEFRLCQLTADTIKEGVIGK
jgi:hypothetical protein